jgi:hypothetical protein
MRFLFAEPPLPSNTITQRLGRKSLTVLPTEYKNPVMPPIWSPSSLYAGVAPKLRMNVLS